MRHLIFGATGAIGGAVSTTLRARGDSVVGTTRRDDRGEYLCCDVTSEQDIVDTVGKARAELGVIDSVIYLPGAAADGASTALPAGRMSQSLEVNSVGAFIAAREVVRGAGVNPCAITFVGTTNALRGVPGQAAYATGKAALIGLARALAGEFGPRGHRVNVVAPGYIDGGMAAELPEAVRTRVERSIPLRRFAALDEIAEVIAFVAGPHSSYMNGSVIYADGGLAMGH